VKKEKYMRTGFNTGPKGMREISSINPPLNLDQTLEEAVRKSIAKATWLEEADLGAAQQAVQLAATMDEYPNHRHKIAPVLIGLLSNLGLLNNRKAAEMTPADMLAAIANG
jgi:hypothetical protein